MKSSPGIGVKAAEWLAKQDPMLVGEDAAPVEVSPNPDPEISLPVHQIMLVVLDLGPIDLAGPCNTYSTVHLLTSTVHLLTIRLRPCKLKYLVFRNISTLAFRLHRILTVRNEARHTNMRPPLIAGFVAV